MPEEVADEPPDSEVFTNILPVVGFLLLEVYFQSAMISTLVGGVVLQDAGVAAGLGLVALFVTMVPVLVVLAGLWKIFTKAGQPGWAAIIPIYNVYILLKIVGRPTLWLVGFLIPIVNFVVTILVTIDLAKAYGKGLIYAIGMLLIPFIFFPLLGFGSARYQGPVHGGQQQQGQRVTQA